MTKRDSLFERLERLNPVPDPSRLYEDTESSPAPPPGAVQELEPLPPRTPIRRGPLVGAAVMVLVFGVGALIGQVMTGPGDTFGGDPRMILTIEEDGCTYEGPRVLRAGAVEVVYRNNNPEARWANTLRLDDRKTLSEMRSYIAEDPLAGAPSWTTPVLLVLVVPANGEWAPQVMRLEPGTHILLCGDSARGAVYGADVLVTP